MTVFIIVGSSSYPYETSSHLTKVGSMLSLSPKGVGNVSRWIIHLLNIKTNERDSHIQYVPTLCMNKEFEMDNLSLPTIHQFKTWNRYQKLHGNKLYFCNLLKKRHENRDVLQTFFSGKIQDSRTLRGCCIKFREFLPTLRGKVPRCSKSEKLLKRNLFQ